MTEPAYEYIEARRTLLDALDALQSHRDSLVLIGAQAVVLAHRIHRFERAADDHGRRPRSEHRSAGQ